MFPANLIVSLVRLRNRRLIRFANEFAGVRIFIFNPPTVGRVLLLLVCTICRIFFLHSWRLFAKTCTPVIVFYCFGLSHFSLLDFFFLFSIVPVTMSETSGTSVVSGESCKNRISATVKTRKKVENFVCLPDIPNAQWTNLRRNGGDKEISDVCETYSQPIFAYAEQGEGDSPVVILYQVPLS